MQKGGVILPIWCFLLECQPCVFSWIYSLCSSYFVHLSASIVAMTNRLNLFTLFRNNISNVLCSSRTHKHIFDGKSFKRNFSIYSRFFSLLFPFLDVIFYLRAVYQFITHTPTPKLSTEPTRCQTPLHTQAAPTRRCIGWNSTEESSLCGSRTWSTLHRRNKVSENLISFLVQFMLLVFY